ncbi:hypothetical protein [Gracilinema caldarium]|uniref:Uncharacterized protein n=1 Tax=Gracilinema caldarium (strain ATCC 51460 / DSM 7334 / H1) TaxID=744872 RepID=F8EYV4_GRAC1|nr:hypothetical protein [Gracilinema caldarium]AEJ18900.1 hypothetical protein Spica_0746 [Gracilinema caldarium DSM 7334]
MRKIITLVIIALFITGSMVFASDALVLPAHVGRVYVTNSYAFANGAYDQDGKYESYESGEGAFKAYNLGFALEYGVNDWISAAIQWAPGWNLWSDMDMPSLDANINGVYDIFVGAKIQILGEKAPVQDSRFRFAVAPGVKIPLPATDMEEQFKNAMKGDAVTVANLDKHLFAVGGRLYFDYIINKLFFANLYSELVYYPTEGKVSESSLSLYNPTKDKINYGYKLTLEAEPHFETLIDQGLKMSAGLPITYITTPDVKIDGDKVKDTATASLTLGPNASIFFLNTLLPVELQLGYTFPVYGKNTSATQALTLQAKVYFKL